MYDHILIPTDGSDGALKAFEHALHLAEMYDSTIHLIYVVEPIHTADVGTEQVLEAMRAEGERSLGELADRADSNGIGAVTEVRTGSPHREILEYADDEGIDLIVMGTHGRTGLNRYLLGSVTEKIVRISETPVLTIRRDEAE